MAAAPSTQGGIQEPRRTATPRCRGTSHRPELVRRSAFGRCTASNGLAASLRTRHRGALVRSKLGRSLVPALVPERASAGAPEPSGAQTGVSKGGVAGRGGHPRETSFGRTYAVGGEFFGARR